MKKTQPSKLALSRETVRHLDSLDLQNAAGGLTTGCGTLTLQVSFAFSCFQGHCIQK